MNDIQRAIETQKSIYDVLNRTLINSDSTGFVCISVDRMDDIKTAISAMQELQQYHKTGMTPGEVIKMQYGYAVKMVELEEYERIGTLEECREAVEKKKAKKSGCSLGSKIYYCPVCERKIHKNYSLCCSGCGQRIDWREEENDGEINKN